MEAWYTIIKLCLCKVNVYDMETDCEVIECSLHMRSLLSVPRCTETMFECYDGTCIPAGFVCDGVVHCHGPFGEDEPLRCSPRHAGQSCFYFIEKAGLKENIYPVVFEPNGNTCGT